jgi:hypothetical protein
MAKEKGQKDKQHHGQKNMDRRTNNTMVKRKRTEGQTTQWPFLLVIVLLVRLSPFFCPLCCLFFCSFSFGHCVAFHFVPFLFGHCVVCPSFLFFWSLCCLSLMTKRKGQKDKQHNDQKKMPEGEATQWPK